MARLPTPGGDDGDWGDVLNDFLRVSHNDNGTLKNGGLPSWFQTGSDIPVGTVTPSQKGALYYDTTNGALFAAIGTTSADWVALGGNGLNAAQGVSTDEFGDTVVAAGSNAAAALTDLGGLRGTGNGLYWRSHTDGNQVLQVSIGSTGQHKHFWNADGSYTMPGTNITGLADPVNNQDAATKAYVDNQGGDSFPAEWSIGSGGALNISANGAFDNHGLSVSGTFTIFNDGGVVGSHGFVVDGSDGKIHSGSGGVLANGPVVINPGSGTVADFEDGEVGFYGATPVGQQTATDGSGLVSALRNYGLLDGDAVWNDPGINTAQDFFITGDGNIPINPQESGVGLGVERFGNNNPHIELVAPGGGVAYIDFTTIGNDFMARLAWEDTNGQFTLTGPNVKTVAVNNTGTTINGNLVLPDLPTSDPGVAGALWNNGGTVSISAG